VALPTPPTTIRGMANQAGSLLVTSIVIPTIVTNGGKKSNSLVSGGATSGGSRRSSARHVRVPLDEGEGEHMADVLYLGPVYFSSFGSDFAEAR
jgi:hypothetical protein